MDRGRTPAALVLALLLAACGGPAVAPGAGTVRELSEAQAVAELPSRVIIDVRTPAETADGMLAGALNIDFQAPDFRERIGQLDRDASYLLYCRTGNRSAQAAAVMAELGFADVVDAGGFAELVAAGAPVDP
ncbi:MAG TPA: rhodanese-like domain-containing protein [Candidatus Limnocylindria bacterium]|nr:rhodanese-like domain-containing protein [Candidatus Limnocylindria bacterium]